MGSDISATINAEGREAAQRIAEATMVVTSIDEPEDPLDVDPVAINEPPNVGSVPYASPVRAAPPDYQGIVVGSWMLRGCACLCGLAGAINIALIFSRRSDISYLFTAVFWMSIGVALFVGALVSTAIRDIAISSRVFRRSDHGLLQSEQERDV